MSALERWKEAGLVEVGLPSGFRIRVLPVTPTTLVLLNLAPSIVDEVLDATAAGESEEQAGAGLGGTAMDVACRAVRALWDDQAQTWEPVTITAADIVAGAFPPGDLDALMEAALGSLNEQEGQVGFDDLRRFRDDVPGDAGGADGGTVRAAPVEPRRARRAAARAGAGRGTSAPAGAG